MIGDSGSMTLATTVSLPVVRGPVTLAKAITATMALSRMVSQWWIRTAISASLSTFGEAP